MRNALLVALLSGFASTAVAADRTNFEIFRDVSAQVNRYPHLTVFDNIQASVENGVVTLSGKVTMPYKAADIEKRVARIDGVTAVRNTVTPLPVSLFDDQLRLTLARAIYSDPALAMYGLGTNPSIRIVVENGRVTLDGVVNNEMDRMIATSVARSFLAFRVTNQLKTREEMEQAMEQL